MIITAISPQAVLRICSKILNFVILLETEAFFFNESPHSTTHGVARDLSTSQSTDVRVLHRNKLKMVQHLNSEDFNRRRMIMFNRFEDEIQRDPEFAYKVCFSDEATFTLDGQVNQQNFRYWSPFNQDKRVVGTGETV